MENHIKMDNKEKLKNIITDFKNKSNSELKFALTELSGDFEETKYPYVCHAELNAILNRNCSDLTGTTLYSTLFPCNECAKAIIQSGIKKVVYLSDKYHETKNVKVSKRMFEMAGVQFSCFDKVRGIKIIKDKI